MNERPPVYSCIQLTYHANPTVSKLIICGFKPIQLNLNHKIIFDIENF